MSNWKKVPSISNRVVNEYDLISERVNVMKLNIQNYGSFYAGKYGISDPVLESLIHECDAVDYILANLIKRVHVDEILEDVIEKYDLSVTDNYIGNLKFKLFHNHMDYIIRNHIELSSFTFIEEYRTENIEDACLFFTQLIEGK